MNTFRNKHFVNHVFDAREFPETHDVCLDMMQAVLMARFLERLSKFEEGSLWRYTAGYKGGWSL
jgi:hypothetical protein